MAHAGIDYDLDVLEEIRREVVDGLRAVPRGGLEVGGVLFGSVRDGEVRIAARMPLPCEHALGPGFVLSENDEAGLRDLMAAARTDPELAGLRPVGWYRSRTRAKTALADTDFDLHAKFFPDPSQVALVLRPEPGGVARAAFYEVAGSGQADAVRDVTLAPPARRSRGAGGFAHRDAARQAKPPAPPKRPEPEIPRFLKTAEEAARRRRGLRLSWRPLAVALALVFVTAAIAARSYEQRRHASPQPVASAPAIGLRAVDSSGQLVITWDRTAAPVLESSGALLRIVDGASETSVDLSRDIMTKGSVTYARRTGRVDLSMKVYGSRGKVEEAASFLGAPVAP